MDSGRADNGASHSRFQPSSSSDPAPLPSVSSLTPPHSPSASSSSSTLAIAPSLSDIHTAAANEDGDETAAPPSVAPIASTSSARRVGRPRKRKSSADEETAGGGSVSLQTSKRVDSKADKQRRVSEAAELRTSTRRIQKELADLAVDQPPNCSAAPIAKDNLYEWLGTIMGPEGSPYHGGIFYLNIAFPVDYPFKAPVIRFNTKIYHCNINSQGHVCVTGDHRVMTRIGWRSIRSVMVGDEVMSFNTISYAMEWKPVLSVTSHLRDSKEPADQLYRMQGSGMDVIATRDHRMLLARLTSPKQHTGDGLQSTKPIGYETVGDLLHPNLTYTRPSLSTVTSFAHSPVRAVICAGINKQPGVKLVIAGLERVCEWWWEKDGQLGFMKFIGFWLGDGHLDVAHGFVCIGQKRVETVQWLSMVLLPRVFPRWWHRNPNSYEPAQYNYAIRCPPLCNYLRMMAVGPLGYNPRDPDETRSFPHFKFSMDLAAEERKSCYYLPNDGIGSVSTWTEKAMLAAFTAGELERDGMSDSPLLDAAGGAWDGCVSGGPAWAEVPDWADVADWQEVADWDDDADKVKELKHHRASESRVGAIVQCNDALWHLDIDGHWFYIKRWMGDEQQIASVYSQLSRTQAIALLEGFCRADGKWASSIQYDDDGEPTGCWQCSNSSMPLIDHLQLTGQLAGAAVELHLHTRAGKTTTIDGRTVFFNVDHWTLLYSFTKLMRGTPFPTAPFAEPVDVSRNVDARGYYGYEDDGWVYCITVDEDGGSNCNFLTQRRCSKRKESGVDCIRAHSVFIGNCLDILKDNW